MAEEIPTSYLAAGHGDQPVDAYNAIWSLYLHLPAEARAHVADIVTQRGPAMAEIVTAALKNHKILKHSDVYCTRH